jgi:hypothetical protein
VGYINDNLIPSEVVIYRTHLHWIIFLRPAVLVFLVFFGFTIFPIIGLLILLLTLLVMAGRLITYFTSEFGITNRRIIIKVGFVRRDSLDLLIKEVEGILVNQGVIGRFLNYGTITVIGTGGTEQVFDYIGSPLTFQKKVLNQISEH